MTEEGMDKYGVVLDNEKTKKAGVTETGELCPQCGSAVDIKTGHCPKCGTEPFEKKP